MRYKLICCEVLMREICHVLSASMNTIDPMFTPKGTHENPDTLRELIQSGIKEADKVGCYDAVILGYGLCGNATNGITAGSIPLVIPRAHDCCTLFLGSKGKFTECFGETPSLEWSSSGYMERGDSYLRETQTGKKLGYDMTYDDLAERYGEENAGYIWETIHPATNSSEVIFIDMPETTHLGYLEKLKKLAGAEGKTVKIYQGNIRLLRGLLDGSWNEDEFLVVPPGETIRAVYDHDLVITCDEMGT